MATVKAEGARRGAVAAERVQHLAGEFGEHRGIVFAVDHETFSTSAHAALDIRHRADGGPVIAKLVDGDVVAETFPNMIGSHTAADDVGVIRRNVEEAASAHGGVVNQRDGTDGRAEAGAEDGQLGVALLFEPAKAAPSIKNRLAVGLKR